MVKKKNKKDSFNAVVSFIFSLGFFIPLFNIGLSMVSIYLAIKSIRQINKNPKQFGGWWFAIVALIIDITVLTLSLVFFIAYVYSKILKCDILNTI